MNEEVVEQWIIATGLSRGIGHAFAELLKKTKFKVIHLGRCKTGLEDHYIWWDLLNPITDNPLADLTKFIYGKNLIGFFYGAGVLPQLYLKESSHPQDKHLFWQSQREAMQVNYFACAELLEEILPFLMTEHEETATSVPFIAHLCSLSAVDPYEGFELYGLTKNATLNYFNWLAKRFSPDKLSCLSIHPGIVLTDMAKDLANDPAYKNLPISILFKKNIDEKKLLSPQESAKFIFEFIFSKSELLKQAHGKLYLADKKEILEKIEI